MLRTVVVAGGVGGSGGGDSLTVSPGRTSSSFFAKLALQSIVSSWHELSAELLRFVLLEILLAAATSLTWMTLSLSRGCFDGDLLLAVGLKLETSFFGRLRDIRTAIPRHVAHTGHKRGDEQARDPCPWPEQRNFTKSCSQRFFTFHASPAAT